METLGPLLKGIVGTDVAIDIAQRLGKIFEGFQKQNDWYRNTGQKMKYPFSRDFRWGSLNEARELSSRISNGIDNSKLYQGNTNITRWLNK